MDDNKLSEDQLRQRLFRFYNRYGRDLEQVQNLLEVRLNQLALAYTIENNLPPEAIKVHTRIKALKSTSVKLDRKNWPQFRFVTDVIQDIIGARVICWFRDDCYGYLDLVSQSKHINVSDVVDYIKNPKPSGYRSIHCIGNLSYDGVEKTSEGRMVIEQRIPCEIQIRTKLQDSWADVTHEFHYKALNNKIDDSKFEGLLAEVSHRLANEDTSLIKFRDVYHQISRERPEGQVSEIYD